MKIVDKFGRGKVIFSLEVFPPKKFTDNIETVYETLDKLTGINPDYISVTYSAGGNGNVILYVLCVTFLFKAEEIAKNIFQVKSSAGLVDERHARDLEEESVAGADQEAGLERGTVQG